MKLRLSSRQSALAQIQAYQVGAALEKAHAGLEIEYLFRESLGDKNLTDPLWKMPEKGVFTEDFFRDLTENKTDLVVHSWKDLPTAEKDETRIVATLPRADQRDLLLFKKSSLKKPLVKIYSSSPRRTHNIKPLLNWALPWQVEEIEFQNVRGNIPTRIQKLLAAEEIDGLIVAKAALDRLLTEPRFPETILAIRQALEKLNWMVLPLCENPNAAAQGALAIEISSQRTDVLELISAINCSASFSSAQREREILTEFGGGCHLALGMSVLERPYGRIEIVKGLTPANDQVVSKKFFPSKIRSQSFKVGRMEFSTVRKSKEISFSKVDALYVSKAEAFQPEVTTEYVWTAGIKTWKKLAALGVWVHGSSEGLGEAEDAMIEALTGSDQLKWGRLTHDDAVETSDKISFGSYRLELELKTLTLDSCDAYKWKSGSEFLLAIKHFPDLKNRFHICGPGRTYDTIKKTLGTGQNIFVELNDEFITVV